MDFDLIGHLGEGQMMSRVAGLAARLFPALLSQAAWATMKAVGGGWQAAVMAVLCQVFLQCLDLAFQFGHTFAQHSILRSQVLQFFFRRHAATLADGRCVGQRASPKGIALLNSYCARATKVGGLLAL